MNNSDHIMYADWTTFTCELAFFKRILLYKQGAIYETGYRRVVPIWRLYGHIPPGLFETTKAVIFKGRTFFNDYNKQNILWKFVWNILWRVLTYRNTFNICRTLVGNKIVDNSDVVGASPVGAAPTTSSLST